MGHKMEVIILIMSVTFYKKYIAETTQKIVV